MLSEDFYLPYSNSTSLPPTLYLGPSNCSSLLNASLNLGDAPALCDATPTPWTVIVTTPTKRRPDNLTMLWWQQLAWTAIFALMLFVAIGGNAIVIWIVLAHRRMRTVTNYFLVNLSVADMFMAIFNCIFNFVYMLNSDWYFGNSYCTVNNFIANVSVAASVFTLTGISFDRYLAIVRPLKPRMSKVNAQVTIVLIWLASMTLGSPCLFYSATYTYKYNGRIRTACIIIWPDGQQMTSTLDTVYNVVLLLVTYFLPMCAMIACYTAMGRELWGSRSIGEMTQRQSDSIRSKRKVVRMFIMIVLIFAICWLPYHGYFIYTNYNSSVTYTSYIQHLYLAFYWLAMSNSMVNPLIYYWMNARFRQYFKDAICEWRCLRRQKNTGLSGAETPPLSRHYSHSYSRSRSGNGENNGRICHPSNPCCRVNQPQGNQNNQSHKYPNNHFNQRSVQWFDSSSHGSCRNYPNNNVNSSKLRCGNGGHNEWCCQHSITNTAANTSLTMTAVGTTTGQQYSWRREQNQVATAKV